MTSNPRVCPRCGERTFCRDGRTEGKSHKQRWACKKHVDGKRKICYRTTDPNAPYRGDHEPDRPQVFEPAFDRSVDTIIITWAQNATPLHKGFWKALQRFRKDRKAALLVQPGRYQNPTSVWPASQANEQWWKPETVPYLVNVRTVLNRHLWLLADIPVQPTTQFPLRGFEGSSHSESCIIPHPKLQVKPVAVPYGFPKVMTTTGACTVKNYTKTGAGKKGEDNHIIGAAVVEIINKKRFHLHQIIARKDGAFCFLDKSYHPDGSVRPAGPWPVVMIGDLHRQFTNRKLAKSTYGPKGLVDKLQPRKLVFQDFSDMYSANHHHEDNPFLMAAKHDAKMDIIMREIEGDAKWLREHTHGRETYVIVSNHHDFFVKWMRKNDWRKNHTNTDLYLETAWEMKRESKIGRNGFEEKDPYIWWMRRLLPDCPHIHFLTPKDSLMIAGTQFALHGHQGKNGAKGSLSGFARLGVKTMTGHGHEEGMLGGATRVGTSTPLWLEYTGPIGGWSNTHGGLDPFGKPHLLRWIEGAFWL